MIKAENNYAAEVLKKPRLRFWVIGVVLVILLAAIGTYWFFFDGHNYDVNISDGNISDVDILEIDTSVPKLFGTMATGTIAAITEAYDYYNDVRGEKRCIETNSDIGPEIDMEIYLRLKQALLPSNPKQGLYGCPTIQDFRVVDVNNDGNEEVLGFVYDPGWETIRTKSVTLMHWRYVMATRYGLGDREGYSVNFVAEPLFNFAIYDTDVDNKTSVCSVDDVSFNKISIRCSDSTGSYTYVLSENNGEYVLDPKSNAVIFNDDYNWKMFDNERWGLSFKYPADVVVSDGVYQYGSSTVPVISGKRNGKTLFNIVETSPNEYMDTKGDVFIRLADGTYLVRETRRLSKERLGYIDGVTYFQADRPVYGEIYTKTFGNHVLFSPLNDEASLREVDMIFASLRLGTKTAETKDIIPVPNNIIAVSDIASMEIFGFLIDKTKTDNFSREDNKIFEKSFKVLNVPSEIFNHVNIDVKLYKFGSVGTKDVMLWTGAYDAVNDICIASDEENKSPEEFGLYKTCRYGYGDAGMLSVGYYILDPERKYIANIYLNSSYRGDRFYSNTSGAKYLETVVKSFRFNQ